ncbi:MAG TPA: OB-fold domain-containing protein [Candidatus Thermoplasmatota archaeon]|jgi:hydroxymethylglutaryl-CoA synthase|nr:OB-fold domain-containing protein [Candidatus Thermoplasmatota archaeon]
MTGIQGYAVHLPRLRISADAYRDVLGRVAGRFESKRVADHDEDEATLAIAAARALHALKGPEPAVVLTASEEAPPLGPLLVEAMNLAGARVAEHRGPTAGLDALLAARDAVAQGAGAALVVSADAPRFGPGDDREHVAGAAASAWLVAPKGPAQLRRDAHAAAPEPADALAGALRALTRTGLHADSVARAAVPDQQRGALAAAQAVLPKAKLAAAGPATGHAGATAPLLSLARALEEAQAGETLVAAACGAGRAVALSIEVERSPVSATLRAALARPAEALDHPRLARLRGWLSPPASDVSQGAAVSAAQWAESLPARLRWQGQRCMACSTANFPPREACLRCGAARLEPLAFSGLGEVHSIVTIGRGGAPSEFAEQQRRAGAYDVAIVQLAEGPRVAAMVADAAPGQLHMGDAVELVVRRLYTQDGAPRYGFKARPA